MSASILLSALRAVGKSCVAALAGVVAVNADLMGVEAVEDLSKLTGKLLLPCFLVSGLSAQVTAEKLAAAWALPVFAAVNLALGLLLGKALSAALGQRGHKSSAIIMTCCTFSNTSALPLALMAPILSSHPVFSSGTSVAAAQQLSVVYVSVFSILNKVGVWTVGRRIIDSIPAAGAVGQAPCSAPATFVAIPQTFGREDATDLDGPPSKADAVRSFKVHRPGSAPASLPRALMKEPAAVASVLGLLIGLTPAKSLFYDGGLLAFLMDGVHFLGEATLPMFMVVLGASLARGPDAGGLGAEVVASIAAGRLLVMPCLGSMAVLIVYRRIPSAFDPVMLLVLLLETCMPSAESLALLAQLRGGQIAKDMSTALFYQYIVSPLTISAAASLALWLISREF